MIWNVTTVAVLDRRMYAISEAARLLEVPPATLRRWLEGFSVRRVTYPAVIRPTATGSPEVTWAEFVEAGYLREYRTIKRVSLQKLRRFIDLARDAWGVPYPLAHFKPLVDLGDRELLILLKRLQDEAGLDEELQPVVEPESGQLRMGGPFQQFLQKVKFDEGGIATSIRPLGHRTAVVIDPEVSFGVPQIRGVRTETVAEALATGESEENVARTFGLSLPEIRAAIQWELRLVRRTEAA